MTPTIRSLAFVAGAVAIVALLAWWMPSDETPPLAATEGARNERIVAEQEALRRQLERLRAQIQAESEARAVLEADLARLRGELAAVGRTGDRDSGAVPGSPLARPLAVAEPTDRVDERVEAAPGHSSDGASPGRPASDAERPMFDVGRLVALGIHPQDADELLGAWEQFSLDRLYLVDQAAREGWLYKPRFQREVAVLEHQMLDDVGEEGWDRLLYGSGQPNRVIVRQVLEGSSADIAGLQPGDVIMRYNDRRVFKTEWLQAATARGRPGNVVRLEVLRASEPVTVDVERGPLGTLLRNTRVPPPVP